MKKILSVFILINALILPLFTLAKSPAPNCQTYCSDPTTYDPPSGQICICNPLKAPDFETLVTNIIDFIFKIAVALAPLMIIIGAGILLTSGGNPSQIETGKKIILYTLIGFAIILLAKGIVAMIKQILGA